MIPDIFELVDAGRGLSYGGAGGISRSRCVRRGCSQECEGDSGFCGPCLAWAKDETGKTPDPRAGEHDDGPPVVAPYPPEPVEEWNDYLQRARRGQ